MELILFGLLLFGILLAIVGWFVDKAASFPAVMRLVSRDYVDGMGALDILASSANRALTPHHPGFQVLREAWPRLGQRERLGLIGRSVAFTEFAATVKNDFELIPLDENRSELGPRWSDREARSVLTERHGRREFWIGTVVFWLGIIISLIAGAAEFVAS